MSHTVAVAEAAVVVGMAGLAELVLLVGYMVVAVVVVVVEPLVALVATAAMVSFGWQPTSNVMHLLTSTSLAKYEIPPYKDDGKPITIRFHLPNSTFGSNMRIETKAIKDAAYHHVLGLLGSGFFRVDSREFNELLLMAKFLENYPDHELDKIHEWIWVQKREDRKGYHHVPLAHEPDNIVVCMCLHGGNPHAIHRPTSLVLEDIR